MAKNMNLEVKFDTSKALMALKGFQTSIKGSQKHIDSLDAKLKALGSTVKAINTQSKKTETALNKIGTTSKETAKAVNLLGKEATATMQKLSRLNGASVKGGEVIAKSFGGTKKIFASIGTEIAHTTKLLAAMSTVAGGIALNKAGGEYMEYSRRFAQFSAVVKPEGSEQTTGLRELVNRAAVKIGIDPSELLKQATTLASGGIEINTSNFGESSKEFEKIITIIGRFAKISGSTFEESSNAVVRMGNAMGYSAKEMSKASNTELITGVLATSLDQGLGTLSEYSTQLNKFVKEGIESGMGIGEVMSLFANSTKNMTTFMSGFTLKAAMGQIGDGLGESRSMTTKISNILNPVGKDAYGNVKEFKMPTEELTKKYRDFLAPLTKSGAAVSKFYYAEDGTKLSGTDSLKQFVAFLAEGKDKGLNPAELAGLITTNENAAKELLNLYKGGLKDFETIVKKFGNYDTMTAAQREEAGVGKNFTGTKEERSEKVLRWATSNAMAERNKALEASFTNHFEQASAAYTAMTNSAIEKMNPALSATADIFTNMFTGNASNLENFRKIINDNYNNLKETNPELAKIVQLLGDVGIYAGSGEMKDDFLAVAEAVSSIFSAIKSIFTFVKAGAGLIADITKPVRDMLGMGAGANAIAALFAYGAMKVVGASLAKGFMEKLLPAGGKFFAEGGVALAKAFANSAAAQSLGKLGGDIATGFYSKILASRLMWASAGLAFGIAASAEILKRQKEADDFREKQKEGMANPSDLLSKMKKPAMDLTPDEFGQRGRELQNISSKPITITDLNNVQRRILSDVLGGGNMEARARALQSKGIGGQEIANILLKENEKVAEEVSKFTKSLSDGRITIQQLFDTLGKDNYTKFLKEDTKISTSQLGTYANNFSRTFGMGDDVVDARNANLALEYGARLVEYNSILTNDINTQRALVTGTSEKLDKTSAKIIEFDMKQTEALRGVENAVRGVSAPIVNALGGLNLKPIINLPTYKFVGPIGTSVSN